MIRSGKVESVKQRLKNTALKHGIPFNDALRVYFLERFLYRLSISKYNDSFILKGGILLYAIIDEDYSRKTVDIDLLVQRIDNNAIKFNEIIKEICSIETDDPIRFDVDNIVVKNITEFKGEYHGLNVYIPAYLDRTEGRISVDVGFGDIIYPDKQILNFPSLLDQEPRIFAYSIETVIAEKLEAIVKLGMLNSRLKDFYDIYSLSKTFDFDGDSLNEAIKETFNHRGTSLGHIYAFDDDFISPYRKGQWRSFIKQKDPKQALELETVITNIKGFVNPIISDNIKRKKWNHIIGEWEN